MPSLRSSVAEVRANLVRGREKLRRRHREGTPGVQLAQAATDQLDAALLKLFEAALADLDAVGAVVMDEQNLRHVSAADEVDSTFAPRSGMLGPMDRDEICARFLEAVEFDLYTYQEEALLAWFEEKEEVFVHARDPFKRIDTVKTDRHVKVIVNGETVAETTESVMLLEPGHPVRYYLPMADVRAEVLRPSDTISNCAYKGSANYFSIAVGDQTLEDAAWEYKYPTPESSKVMGMLCFFNERVDAIIVNGEELAKPITNWRR